MDKDIIKAMHKLSIAEKALLELLEKRWPVGTKILCNLRYKQKTPSEMEVCGHRSQGYVIAWMPSKKARFGRFVKDVYVPNIVG